VAYRPIYLLARGDDNLLPAVSR